MKSLLIALGVVLVIILVVVAFFAFKVNRPGLAVSTLVPGHNAFDYFQQAASLEANRDEVDDAAQNHPTRVYSLAEKESLVRQNAPALAKLRQGLQFEYMNPAVVSADQQFPYYAQFRALARLLHLESEVETAKKDYAGAASSDLDAVQMGEDIPHGSVLIGMLVGVACQAIGRKPLWETMSYLNESQAKACTARMESIMSDHYALSDTWRSEKVAGEGYFGKVANDPTYPQSVLNMLVGNGQQSNGSQGAPAWLKSQASAVSAHDFMVGYDGMMDKLIQSADASYSPASVPQPGSFYLERIFLPVFNKGSSKDLVDDQAENGLLETLLAIHAYKLDHKALPSTLKYLVPGYLSKVPDDPFTDHAPLRYKVNGSHFVLYSIGPDGIDNGGVPIQNATDADGQPITGPAKYYVNSNSHGDIVAGVNIT